MKNILLTFVLTIFASLAFAQSITNISPAQRTDGSMIIDIYYDLSGPEPAYTIAAEVSFNAGSTFSAVTNVTGDAGAGITPGTGKHIIWNFGTQFPGQFSNEMQIRITASLTPWACGDPLIDTRDAQSYATVQIGTQCWMAENMNIGTMVNNTNNQLNNSIIEKYCYNNNPANCNVYGGLYQWNEMMQYVITPGAQGICPTGWHLPTDVEWCTLEQYVDATISCGTTGWRGVDGGGKLKETGTIHWLAPNAGATNSSGFTALPGGYRYMDGSFSFLAYYGYFWSSSESSTSAWHRYMSYNNAKVSRISNFKDYGFSARCLQDVTPPTWNCGQPLSVTHTTTGDIAPVNKTVDYGTVETNLTGSNKCWITQNLGSDQQAVSVTDATEASAGWYWQFNRRQGYKHDGTTRTPNTTWISSINESSDWLPVNDPCTLLLGGGWRLPTSAEWTNADANDGWNNYNQTYASVLKLHAAGYLSSSSGSLNSRGTNGDCWSSTQDNNTSGRSLHFTSSFSGVSVNSKAYGFSSRCLKD